jgi:para-aminobenzoate synthetase/4-amino-4-deoxychorismate lyase
MTALPPPDPQLGVFETMLVQDGHPIELDAHLERMNASLEALFGSEAPSGTRELVLERACDIDLGRLRLTVAPNAGGDLRAEVATAKVQPALVFPSPELEVALRSHVVEGGLGAHKWADRRLLEAAEAEAPAGSVPLLTDGDGEVLEASRANVFLVRDGALITPPADGRILPGIARRRAIEVAGESGIEVREEAVAPNRIAEADEVFLTGSVRGIEPVSSLDGAGLASGGEISGRIAAGLRQRWLGATELEAAPTPAAAPPPGRPAR